MSEIDIVEEEARQNERVRAEARGDKPSRYKITIQNRHKRLFRRRIVHTEEGTILVQDGESEERIIYRVIDDIKYCEGLIEDYEAIEFACSPQ